MRVTQNSPAGGDRLSGRQRHPRSWLPWGEPVSRCLTPGTFSMSTALALVGPGAAVGVLGCHPGQGPWRLTLLSSLPRVLCPVLGAEQPLHPLQEAPAGRGCPEEQVSGVQLRPALRLQAQHEGPRAQAAPPAPRWASGGPRARAGYSRSLHPGRLARGPWLLCPRPHVCPFCPDPLARPASGAPPAWSGRSGLLKLALTSSSVPSCPSTAPSPPFSCPALPRIVVETEQIVSGRAQGQSANCDESRGDSAHGAGRPDPRALGTWQPGFPTVSPGPRVWRAGAGWSGSSLSPEPGGCAAPATPRG